MLSVPAIYEDGKLTLLEEIPHVQRARDRDYFGGVASSGTDAWRCTLRGKLVGIVTSYTDR
jgi:hypothetical protein